MNQKERMLANLPYKAWLDGLTEEREACAKLLNIDNAADFMRIFYPQASI